MNVSIVIPVYNEALELDACLRAIATQIVRPLEVIVVDNNSTDSTRAVAERYDFVTLLTEVKQGVVHARTTGFNAARGEIIGRIDADTLLPEDWVQKIQKVFQDPTIDAVSGSAQYYDLSAAHVFNAGDVRLRRYLAKQLKGSLYLWGANMALRKTAWQRIQHDVCYQNGVHEDYDIGLHLQQYGFTVVFNEALKVGVSCRRINVSYLEFMRYTWASPRTYVQHHAGYQLVWYLVVGMAAFTYLPWHIMHRGYDPQKRRFTLRQLLENTSSRVDPTTNVV